MSKSEQPPSFEKRRVRAEDEFRGLMAQCLDRTSWGDWVRVGGFLEQQPKSLIRRRTANIERLFPADCYQEVWPLHDDSAWSGPKLRMDEAEAQMARKMTVGQMDSAPYSRLWRARPSYLEAEQSRYNITLDSGYQTKPVFPPHRALTPQEIEDFEPYGGYQEMITTKSRHLQKGRYTVEDRDGALSIGRYASHWTAGWPKVEPIESAHELDILKELNDLILSQVVHQE